MLTTQELFAEYLRSVGGLAGGHLGGDAPRRDGQSAQDDLIQKLQAVSESSRRLTLLIVSLHLAVIPAIVLLLLFWPVRGVLALSCLIAVSGIVVLVMLDGIRALRRESLTADLIVAILPNVSPDTAKELIQTIYFGSQLVGLKKRGRRARGSSR